VLFDPFGEYLRPRLQGYRLERGKFQPIPLEADGTLRSQTTGLTFRPEGLRLRLVDTATGRPTLWHEELEVAFAQQTAAQQAEAAARRAAEERIRALEAELSRLRRQ
jgi:hypothetical protein